MRPAAFAHELELRDEQRGATVAEAAADFRRGGFDLVAIAAGARAAIAGRDPDGIVARLAAPAVVEILPRWRLVARYAFAGRGAWARRILEGRATGRLLVVVEAGEGTTIDTYDAGGLLLALDKLARAAKVARAGEN